MALTFDPDRHEYRYDGDVVPSVTQILRPLTSFDMVDPDILRRAQDFGTAVHLACELQDHGTLDEESLDPALLPYLNGWRQFVRKHKCVWHRIEHSVYHPTMRYAGKLDRRGIVDGHATYVDIKTGSNLFPSVGPQLAAYAAADAGETASAYRRLAVRLVPDGYEVKEYTNPTDWAVFASLVTLRQFCRQHQITCKEITHD